jgi:pimeloyl-ACP methyl ester carboxylesterase
LRRKGEEELGSRVGGCVHRAVAAALDPGEEGYLQIVTRQPPNLKVTPLQPEAGQTNVTAVAFRAMDELGVRKADYFGYSLGGWIGFGLAKDAP